MRKAHTAMRAGLTAACTVFALALAYGEQVRTATTAASALQDGESHGVAVTSKGRLLLAPRISPLGAPGKGSWPAQVFAAAVDASGNVLLATGPDGEVLKITPSGETTTLFSAPEPLVTAILVLADGDVLAATAPGGTIYRMHPRGRAMPWCATNERYVWALAPAPNGAVVAATGERGRLLSIDRNGTPSVLFDSDESHLVSILPAAGGGFWVGGSGRGLVYKIGPDGRGAVIYDDDLPEAKAMATDADGRLVVAFDAPPASDRRPPAVRIRVAGGGAGPGNMDELDSRGSPAMQGVIEGLPGESDEEPSRTRGKIVRVSPDGTALELWRSGSEAAFAVGFDAAGRAVFATGEPAKLWRVERPDEVSLLATLKEAQATAVVSRESGGLVVATSNPAGAYVLAGATSSVGTYVAPPSDAGSLARWGTLSWVPDGRDGRVELFARTGNSSEPDGTWSAWSPALTRAQGAPLTGPEGRFLQWRVSLSEGSGDGPAVASVTTTYVTRNRPPALRDLRVDPVSAAVSGKATLRWSTSDPDGDPVAVEIQARRVGSSGWVVAARSEPPPARPVDPSQGNDASARDGRASWETATWDEGTYDVRAVASDQPGNPPGEGLDATTELEQRVRIDRSAPEIAATRGRDKSVEIVVSDEVSGVARLEVVENGRAIFSPRASDGICDGEKETFHLSPADAGASGARSLRATDTAGNAAETAIPGP